MRETFGVPPVVPASPRSRSRLPLWTWLFAAVGMSFTVSAAVLLERAGRVNRTPGPSAERAATTTSDLCAAAAKRLELLAARAHRCHAPEATSALVSARTSLLLAYDAAEEDAAAGDDAMSLEVRDSCELVLDEITDAALFDEHDCR